MKPVFIIILLFTVVGGVYSQGITLLFKGGGAAGWNDADNWIQINTPDDQLPIQRVPTELDDVVFNKSMSGIASAGFSADEGTQTFYIGGNGTTGKRCRSMHISNTVLYFEQTVNADLAATLHVYTSNGGFVLIDSGANVFHGLFELHGGSSAITDLQIINSSYGFLFSHAVWSNIRLESSASARFVNSNIEGWDIVASGTGGEFYAENCVFKTTAFRMADNSTDTILNCSIVSGNNMDYLNFLIGRDAHFVSDNFNVKVNSQLTFCTSGSEFNGDVETVFAGGSFRFIQEDPAKPLPNIINGNLTIAETYGIDIIGGLKISGNITFYAPPQMFDTTHVYVNGQRIFRESGIYASCTQGFCPSKIEFFGNNNSNVYWTVGFPVDTLIINKSGCAKVTFTNSLYVSAAAKILQGQLALDPNDTIPYKFVCAGDLNIAQGGGVFLRKNAAGIVANMAIDGNVFDYNTVADSNCVGLSNPYSGDITLYKTAQGGGNKTLTIMSNSNIGNLNLTGEPGADFMLGGNLMVNNFSFVNTGKLLLGAYNLTVNGNISNYGPSNYFVTNGLGKLQINNIGNVETVFPVGISSSSYTPAKLTNVGTTDNFGVNVQAQVLSGGNSGRAYTTAVVNRTWNIDESIPGGSNISLTLQWNAEDELTGFTRNAAWLSHYISGAWNTGTQMSASGSTPYSITRNNITNFSPFAVMGSSVALPVTLLHFYGRYTDKAIALNWSTETELNTKYFTVEKSFDQLLFNPVVNVPASGYSSGKKNYQYVDKGFLKAINYYRLKNVDLDGVYTYSKTIAVAASADNSILIFPNPVKDELLIRLQDASAETKISIVDSKGTSVKELKLKAGATNISINTSNLSPGIYSIVFYTDNVKKTQQFVKR